MEAQETPAHKLKLEPIDFWQRNFREGMIIPLFGFNFKVGMMEGNDLLLEVVGPTNALLKELKRKGKKR